MIKDLRTKKVRTKYGDNRSISLVAHAGKVLLKIIATRFNAYCKVKGLLPEEQYRFCPHRLTTGMVFVVRRLQELDREARVSLFFCVLSTCRRPTTLSTAHSIGCSLASEYHHRG